MWMINNDNYPFSMIDMEISDNFNIFPLLNYSNISIIVWLLSDAKFVVL